MENNSADSHQHSDRYRYYARSNELHGIKMKIDRSPHYEESGHFRSTENSGHEGSKSLRVIIIFKPLKRIRSWKFCSLFLVVNWRLIFHNQVYDICNSCEFRKFDAYADEIFFEGRLNPRYFFFTVLKSIHGKLCFI